MDMSQNIAFDQEFTSLEDNIVMTNTVIELVKPLINSLVEYTYVVKQSINALAQSSQVTYMYPIHNRTSVWLDAP